MRGASYTAEEIRGAEVVYSAKSPSFRAPSSPGKAPVSAPSPRVSLAPVSFASTGGSGLILNHPRVNAARYASQALYQEAQAIRSERMPHLYVQAAYGQSYGGSSRSSSGGSCGSSGGSCGNSYSSSYGSCGKSSGSCGSRGSSAFDGWRERHEVRLVLTQQLFDGFRSRNTQRAAEARARAAEYSARSTAQLVAVDFSTAYLDLLQAQEIAGLARENVAVHKALLNQTSDKRHRGLRSQSDVDLVASRLSRAQSLLQGQELMARDALARYRAVARATGGASARPPRANPAYLQSLDTGGNWEVLAASQLLSALELDQKAAKALRLPRVDLELGGRTGDALTGDLRNDREEFSALVVASYDILDGGYRRAEINRTQAGAAEAYEMIGAAQLDAEQLWSQGQELRVSAIERMRTHRRYADTLEDAIRALETDYEATKQPVLNLLDLKDELFEARSLFVVEKFNLYRGEYAMLAASGKLVDTLEGSDLARLVPATPKTLRPPAWMSADAAPQTAVRRPSRPAQETPVQIVNVTAPARPAPPAPPKAKAASNEAPTKQRREPAPAFTPQWETAPTTPAPAGNGGFGGGSMNPFSNPLGW